MPRTSFHEHAKRLFYEAAKLPAAKRSAFLRRRCQGEERLRREVESLLAYIDEDDGEAAGGTATKPGPRGKPRSR